MIFVTVGTHEQGMNRLFEEIDNLIKKGEIKETVFAQIGYSTYKPVNFKYKEMISFDEMNDYINQSRITITHGGPGSIFQVLNQNKVPIVVPRNPTFDEHVDDHQILFVSRIEAEKKVIGVYNIKDLIIKISEYNQIMTANGYT